MTRLERFETKYIPEPNSGCWLWMGSTDKDGYGKFSERKHWSLAHRVAYELFVGPIPFNLQIDHTCRVRCCVNPAHLEPVSLRENARRGMIHRCGIEGLVPIASETSCMRGHKYEPGSFWLGLNGRGKVCRICFNAWASARRKKRSAA